MRPGWAPSMPRGDGVLPGGVNHPPGAYRISAVRPAPCSRIPPAGSYLTRRHRGFTVVRPSGLPLACRPRVEQGLLGFSPELRTPPLPATHVQVETGHRTRTRDYPVIGATADPLSKGQSTHHTRPRVARPPERCSLVLGRTGLQTPSFSQVRSTFPRSDTRPGKIAMNCQGQSNSRPAKPPSANTNRTRVRR